MGNRCFFRLTAAHQLNSRRNGHYKLVPPVVHVPDVVRLVERLIFTRVETDYNGISRS